ncbi:MAG TPA: hypothetical protein VFP33_02465 [Gallionella sp.]|nr:hypothetical protein [Gallionella sp.]
MEQGSRHFAMVQNSFVCLSSPPNLSPDWCEKGHVGFVIQGELEIDFHGHLVRYPEGSGIFIPAGAESGHKARSITPSVLLFLVEDI